MPVTTTTAPSVTSTTSPVSTTPPSTAPVSSPVTPTPVGGRLPVLVVPASNATAAARSYHAGGTTAANPTGHGYWTVTNTGKVVGHDGARVWSKPSDLPRQPVRALVPTLSGTGYWLLTKNGHVYAYGAAKVVGGQHTLPPNQTATGMTVARGHRGYWIVNNFGQVFTHGALPKLGREHAPKTNPAVGISATNTGDGYWIVQASGAVQAFGDAKTFKLNGAPAVNTTNPKAPGYSPAVQIIPTATSQGYWVVLANGDMLGYGDAATIVNGLFEQ